MTMDDETSNVDALLAALLERVLSSSVSDEMREIDGPHIVVCHDPITNTTSFQGPYPNGMLALQSAQMEATAAANDETPDGGDVEQAGLRYSVAPLHPPLAVSY